MNLWEKGIFFFSCLLDGMIVPVMSLIYLEHGASIENLAIFITIYSVTVIVLEVPSGMMADVLGRKRIFILSHIALMAYYITTLLSNSAVLLVFANLFHGAGRAFGSGSLEALLIDKAIEKQGENNLKRINSQMIVLNSIALAAGAILGGILGTVGTEYSVLLTCIIVMEVVLFITSGIVIKEKRDRKVDRSLNESFANQLRMMGKAMKTSDLIKIMLFMSITLAMNLTLVEVYWQQKLLYLLPENMGWFFGVVSCMGYVGLSLGSKIGEYVSENRDVEKVFWVFRMFLPCVVICLGQSFHWWMFLIVYIMMYVVWGIGDLQEGTIFHQHVESEYRASMLSVKSLFVKGGCAVTSALSSMIIYFSGLQFVWILIPIITLLITVVCIIVRHKKAFSFKFVFINKNSCDIFEKYLWEECIMGIKIRLAEEKDYDSVERIMKQVQMMHTEWRPDIYKNVKVLLPHDMFMDYVDKQEIIVAVLENEDVVGILIYFTINISGGPMIDRKVMFIDSMAVDEKYRGQGIGHELFAFVRNICAKHGYDGLELQVNAKNIAAKKMYEKYGFIEKSINMELLNWRDVQN